MKLVHLFKFKNLRPAFYFKIWRLYTKNSFTVWLGRRNLLAIFLAGKTIRFVFYFIFLYFLVKVSNGFSGYTPSQMLFFTLTFITIDTSGQLFFRSVYTFRQQIISGDFDLVLLKPVNALFRSLMGGADFLDLITLPPIILLTAHYGLQLNPTLSQISMYIILIICGLVISAAFHIMILALGVTTLEIDNTIQVYRDLVSMGRFPVDIYKEPLKSILTFIVPVGLMVTLPAKALMGFVSLFAGLMMFIFSTAIFFLSLKFWQISLKKYTSASS